MLSNSVAEWIVCRCISKERAASIAGDLIEIKIKKGDTWFWLSLAGIVVSLVWRRFLAFLAALYAGGWAMSALQMAVFGIHSEHPVQEIPWVPWFSLLLGVGSILWAVLLYGAIRYGLADQTTQLTLALTALVTTVVGFWWQPVVLATCIAASILVAVISISVRERRTATVPLMAAIAAGVGTAIVLRFLDLRRLVYTGLIGDRELRMHPSIAWIDFCSVLTVLWMITAAFSHTHDYFLRKRMSNSETEGEVSV
jgi:hypothetical protein